MPTEKPIIFSTDMVQAILDGRKNQTRRVIKPQAERYVGDLLGQPCIYPATKDTADPDRPIKCPYGTPGTQLWVRETWRPVAWNCDRAYWQIQYKTGQTEEIHDCLYPPENPKDADLHLRLTHELTGKDCPSNAEGDGFPQEEVKKRMDWKPSIHMPRGASRIQLEVTDVKVDRVQDITVAGILAEGVNVQPVDSPDIIFAKWIELWNAINADRGYGWDENPWVWAIEFNVLSTTNNPNGVTQ